jgi:serine/threonine protein kinase
VSTDPRRTTADPRGKYRLLMPLGEGGTANVHLAVMRGPSGFHKLVVLKLLRKNLVNDPEFRAMFLKEARLSARLNHRNIVQTYEVLEDEGVPVIVMEYLEGESLWNVLIQAASGPPVPLRVHLKIISEVLCGLQYSHDLEDYDGKPLGLVHRDMTPHNVFVTFDGQVKILDFGIAKLSGSTAATQLGVVKGKLRYMPAEQIESKRIDRRADLFAVGVMLWEAATGERMWKGTSEVTIMHAVVKGEVPSPRTVKPDVPDELERICMKALAREANDRYASATDFQRDVEALLRASGPPVASSEIGDLLVSRFGDARDETRRVIQRELTRPDSSAPSGGHGASAPRPAPARTSKRIGVAAAVAAATLVLWGFGHARYSPLRPPASGEGEGGHAGRGGSGKPAPPGQAAREAKRSCAEDAKLPYVLSDSNALYRFDPAALEFTKVGTLSCPTSATVNSMAVDRDGRIWVNYREDGRIYKVDPHTLDCETTAFAPGGGVGFSNGLSLAFAIDDPGSDAETLYVSDHTGDTTSINNAKGIAKMDLATMTLTPIGRFSGALAGARCELASGRDGRVFGFFEGKPAVIAGIDKNAGIATEQRTIRGVNSAEESYAFSWWAGSFWLYTGANDTDYSTVTRYDPATGEIKVVVSNTGFRIAGAGVSTCALVAASEGRTAVREVAAGDEHTCALSASGKVRCWGDDSHGQLGYGGTPAIGKIADLAAVGDVDVGGGVRQIAAGGFHTCAVLDTGKVRCWGSNSHGQLGYGSTRDIGDDENPASAGDVDVGGAVRQIVAGGAHTCALLETGTVRCWGDNSQGQLGYGHTNDVGDDEKPATAGDVDVGGPVEQVAAGGSHTCALLATGHVRCWGSGADGRLGYGNMNNVGDDETPAQAGDVVVGGKVRQVAAGHFHTCALLDTGKARCWGAGGLGRLGYDGTNNIGNDETPASAGDLPIDGIGREIAAGGSESCVLLETGKVRCWGLRSGKPSSSGYVNVGEGIVGIATGRGHVCAVLDSGGVRCWGDNRRGQLGVAADGADREWQFPPRQIRIF